MNTHASFHQNPQKESLLKRAILDGAWPTSDARIILFAFLLGPIAASGLMAQTANHGPGTNYGRSYKNYDAGRLQRQAEAEAAQARAQAQQERARAQERIRTQERAREEARIKAAVEEQRRQKVNGVLSGLGDSFGKGGPGGYKEIPEAPWGFGPSPYEVNPNEAGLAPQPGQTYWDRGDGTGYFGSGYFGGPGGAGNAGDYGGGANGTGAQAYVDNYALSRELSGRPLPPDFFNNDPAVVKYDSVGNPIDRDGYVVEYQSEAVRQAAIIEARASVAAFKAQQAAENRTYQGIMDAAMQLVGKPVIQNNGAADAALRENGMRIMDERIKRGEISPNVKAFFLKLEADSSALMKKLNEK